MWGRKFLLRGWNTSKHQQDQSHDFFFEKEKAAGYLFL